MRAESVAPVRSLLAQADARIAALSCAVVAVAIVLVFHETGLGMAQIWRRSETFSHGFFILPISVWLVWRKRAVLASVVVRPFWPGLLLVAGAGFLWLVGSLADAAVVEHFALVFMLQFAVLTVCGLEMTQAVLFPLAFLLFSVPFGDAFVPTLMDWTADFTVLALKFTGIPVYREGNNFVIPSGNWSVVEACSGIRYLIASLMAGTLYAYLMYRSRRKQVLFVAASVLVPIVANWMRAYLIVMMGHLSGNELAVGVDHLIYGWIFFGIVIFAMFWIGARFRDDDGVFGDPTRAAQAGAAVSGNVALAAVLSIGAAALWAPLATALLQIDSAPTVMLAPISGRTGWVADSASPFNAWQPHFDGYRAKSVQVFEKADDRVVIAVLYYAGQTQGRELVNSENVLVTTKDRNWRQTARAQLALPDGTNPAQVRTARLGGTSGRFDVAWWYWAAGRTTTSDAIAKLLLALSRLRLQGDESAAVFVFTEPSTRDNGEQLLQRFIVEMGGAIEQALATTKARQP